MPALRNRQNPPSTLFRNVSLVLVDRVVENGSLRVGADGRIVEIAETALASRPGEAVVDGEGRHLAPGWIDIHCHGDGEQSFFIEPEAVVETLLRNGTTGVLATLGYSQMEPGRLHAQIGGFWGSLSLRLRQSVLGLHLEGPYTSPKYGAASSRKGGCIYPPNSAEYGPILEDFGDIVRYWTFAPEHEGAIEFARAAHARGVVLAAGHTEAGVERLELFRGLGLRTATHWSNASGTPPTRFAGTREPGIDEFALLHDEIYAEVIPDREGCHVRPFLCRLLHKVKGARRVILISDATLAYVEGNEGREVNFNARGELSGSRLTMHAAARNYRAFTGCTLPELFCMGALNPARLFGWDAGVLEPGKRANLILFDDAFVLHGTWLDGERCA